MNELRDTVEPKSAPPVPVSPAQGETPAELVLPPDALIIVPARNLVLFPGIVLPFSLGRPKSIAAAQQAARTEHPIGVVLQRDPAVDDPAPSDLFEVGTVAAILRYLTAPDGNHHVVCQGQQRFRVIEYLPDYPFLVARVERVADSTATGTEIEARSEQLKQRALDTLQLLPNAPAELAQSVQNIEQPAQLADFIAGFMDLKPAEKQDILATFDLVKRLDKLLWLLAHRIEVLRLSRDIGQQTRDSMEGKQREYLLREQLKTIQKELGETDERGAELGDLRKAIAEAGMPPEVEKQANKELARLERNGDVTHRSVEQRGRPTKKIYSLSDVGRKALLAWLRIPARPQRVKDEMMLKTFSSGLLTNEEATELITKHREIYRVRRQKYQELERFLSSGPVMSNRLRLGGYLTLLRDRVRDGCVSCLALARRGTLPIGYLPKNRQE